MSDFLIMLMVAWGFCWGTAFGLALALMLYREPAK